jgi:DNA-binding NarL/FixJ family response regulator
VTFGRPLSSLDVMTARQYEVAILVSRGCTNGEIGSMLGISLNAVKKHVSRLLVLLDMSNRTELAATVGSWPADT